MKNVIAGGQCRVAVRDSETDAFLGYSSGCDYSVETASTAYENEYSVSGFDNAYVFGYCCASFGTGEFSNAEPCMA